MTGRFSDDPAAALRARRPSLVRTSLKYQGKLIRVRVDEYALPNGSVVDREIVEHPGAVVVAALDEDGRVVLCHQYRPALGCELLELPAGLLEEGEAPASAAARELKEETGLIASQWDYLGSFYSSPGFVHEQLHAFLARDLESHGADPDEDEDIVLERLPLSVLIANPEKIQDAKTLATLLLVQARLARGE